MLLTRNDDGTYTQSIYTNPEDVPMLLATADGVIDWAEFHLEMCIRDRDTPGSGR